MSYSDAFFAYGFGVYGVFEESSVDGERHCRYYHHRYHEGVAVGYLGDEEYTGERSVQHTGDDATHSDESEVGDVEAAEAKGVD